MNFANIKDLFVAIIFQTIADSTTNLAAIYLKCFNFAKFPLMLSYEFRNSFNHICRIWPFNCPY